MKTNVYAPSLKRLVVLTCYSMFISLLVNAQNTFPSTGRVGIYTTSPAASLQVKGGARIGTFSNYVNIDSATGNLSFVGTSGYQVGGNKYAFQYTGNPNYGLFFNSSSVQYEFRNGSAAPVFSVNANTGNSALNGTLKIGAYTLPATDGTSGQVLKTNGAGALTWSADNGTSYTAGTGISISGTTITNTVPDKTVALTAGTGISVTGTYPSFTITNTGGSSGNAWSLTGNANTDSSVNFIGTTDAHPLVFRVYGSKAGYLDYNPLYGNAGFGYVSLANNIPVADGEFYTGLYNTAMGYSSLFSNTKGSYNTASGYNALYNNVSSNNNTAYGASSLYASNGGHENTAVGTGSMSATTTGSSNTAIGYSSLLSNKTGNSNVAIGNQALYSNTAGSNLVAIGDHALADNGLRDVSNQATNNTAVGSYALSSNTKGYDNTAIGSYALSADTISGGNVAVGSYALAANTGGSNTAVGSNALISNTTGYGNTANGKQSLYYNQTGAYNTAIGFQAMYYNVSGIDNTAVGGAAMLFGNGNYNTAIGDQSLNQNNGNNNTANGYEALFTNSTGSGNVAVGVDALQTNSTGSNNVGVGYGSLSQTTGSNNTAIGFLTNVGAGYTNSTALGYEVGIGASNSCVIGNSSVTFIGGQVGFSSFSDGRFKKNIQTNVPGLNFITQLKPVTYNLDIKGLNKFSGLDDRVKQSDTGLAKNSASAAAIKAIDEKAIQDKEKIVYTGFVAQEVEKAANNINYNFSGVHKPQGDKDNYALDYSSFVVPLVKAVQELSTQNDSLKNENASLRNDLNDLKTLVLSIQQKQEQCSPCSSVTSSDAMQAQSSTTVLTDDAMLQQNVPNPYSNTTVIGYTLPQKFTAAQIIIIDKNGKTLKAVTVSGSGKGSLNVDASLLAAGAYNYSLVIDGRLISTKQMVLAK